MKQRSQSKAASWLPIVSAPDHLPRAGTTSSGLGLHMSVVYKENAEQPGQQASPIEICLNWGFLFSDEHSLCLADKKLSSLDGEHWLRDMAQQRGSGWSQNLQHNGEEIYTDYGDKAISNKDM